MKKIFFPLNFILSFFIGYFSWNLLFNREDISPDKSIPVQKNEAIFSAPSTAKLVENPSLPKKNPSINFLKKDFWQNKIIDEIVKYYRNLRPDKNIHPTKYRNPHRETTVAKLNLLTGIEMHLLNNDFDENEHLKLVEFHKDILKKEKDFFIKRQVVRNLNKIIKFENELEREEYLADLDKRILYLSRYNLLELAEVFLKYAP